MYFVFSLHFCATSQLTNAHVFSCLHTHPFYERSLGDNEEFLLPKCGHYREKHFTAPREKAIVDRFLARLKKADEIIERRNSERTVAYLLVQPSKVPCSIAI